METAGDQLGQTDQHSGRLWLYAPRCFPWKNVSKSPATAGGSANEPTIFYANAAMGKNVKGVALVAKDGFSARYDLDRIHGVFSRPEHKLAGQSYYVDRVLILDAAKGGVATAWMLHEMQARGVVPAALVLNAVNPIMVQGAALAGISP